MRFFRNTIFWLHLVVGLAIGIVIVGLAGSGIILSFEKQLMAAAQGGEGRPPSAGAARLDVETLLANARDAKPDGQLGGITLYSDPNAAAVVNLGRDRRIQLNTYTGQVTGSEAQGLHDFFHTVEDFHRWLAMTGAWRDRGRAVTGAAALGLVGLIVSGLFLWFPRSIRWGSFKAVLLFNWKLRGKARDWNWHNVVGFWILVPLLVIALSGVVMSYDWANRLLFASVGDTAPVREPRAAQPQQQQPNREGQLSTPRPVNLAGLNDLWADTEKFEQPGWTSITMNLGGGRRRGGGGGQQQPAGVTFVVTRGIATNPMNRESTTVDRETGEPLRTEKWSDQSPGRRARSLVLPIHRGEILGLPGQILACITCLGCLLLVYTGFALSYRRFFGKKKRQKQKTATAAAESELATVG